MPKILNKEPRIQKLKNSHWEAKVLVLEGNDVEKFFDQLLMCQ